ncbi:hypothetical protein PAPYR_13451 [Paratrimastix pyriformis]|uniref:Uncharacterized protein n=1 Tax=Paratrimastix pyriformis TaxID=342808 RepID=A0ABQ8U077_9EUKA|nr:hypothetical protein PAPYR_13451 [Paratrimastix pyriformis]
MQKWCGYPRPLDDRLPEAQHAFLHPDPLASSENVSLFQTFRGLDDIRRAAVDAAVADAAKVAAGARKLGLVVAVERVWLQVDPQTCRVLKRGERVDEPFQGVHLGPPRAFRLFTNRATWTPYSASSALAAWWWRLAGPGLLPLPGVGARLGQASLKYLPEAVRGSVSGPGAFSLDVRRSSAVPGGLATIPLITTTTPMSPPPPPGPGPTLLAAGGVLGGGSIQNLNLTRTSTGHSLSPTRGGGGQTQVGPVLDFENTLAIEWDGVTQWTTGCIQRGSRDTAGRYHVTIHAGELVEAITDLARMPPYDEHDFIKEQLHDFIKKLVNTLTRTDTLTHWHSDEQDFIKEQLVNTH